MLAHLAKKYPYFVPRNSLGSLPVYTDIRNAGGRHLVLVRNVDGDARVCFTPPVMIYTHQYQQILAQDLSKTLFPEQSTEKDRLKVEIVRSKHLVISGGRWKNRVTEWLVNKGF